MNIMDLVAAIAPQCRTEIIGIRPGEKLHEVMITGDDARYTLEYKDYYVIKPDFRYFVRRFKEGKGKPVPEDFEYNSLNNPWRLKPEELRKLIKKL
jgi:UDP-N-acetylglucosamine 4,6-dehydratase